MNQCQECRRYANYEGRDEIEFCQDCGKTICDDCVDYTGMNELDTEDTLCNDCTKSRNVKECSICKECFVPRRNASHAETRQVCPKCRKLLK